MEPLAKLPVTLNQQEQEQLLQRDLMQRMQLPVDQLIQLIQLMEVTEAMDQVTTRIPLIQVALQCMVSAVLLLQLWLSLLDWLFNWDT